jgi:arginine decarboxylase
VRYLQFAQSFNQQFPGFDTDIHGLVSDSSSGELRYFVDCVKSD